METVNTSEMLVSFHGTTWHNMPEDSHIHTRCCENLKSHILSSFIIIVTKNKIFHLTDKRITFEELKRTHFQQCIIHKNCEEQSLHIKLIKSSRSTKIHLSTNWGGITG
jgi:hypothetical protein